jgi:acetoin utilization deacetylase AcuC-like enzyme
MTAKETGWYWDRVHLLHESGRGHPESAHRYQVLGDALVPAAAELGATRIERREVLEAELLRVHTADYLRVVELDLEQGAEQLRTGDTPLSRYSGVAAKAAAGAGLAAVEEVMRGNLRRAFVAVRPPGHHATPDQGMGFCIYNTVAVMARHAMAAHDCKRVLIVDWDVHHGNGTQDAFYQDGDVFFFSSHQEAIYPGTGLRRETGEGAGSGTTMNLPLPAGTGGAPILEAIRGPLTKAMEEFKPGLVLISAGFDSRAGDPLGGFVLTDEDFAELTRELCKLAETHAGGRVISVLEGGYHPPGLASAAVAHLRALAGK